MRLYYPLLIGCCFVLLGAWQAHAQTKVEVYTYENLYGLADATYVTIDSTNSLSISEAKTRQFLPLNQIEGELNPANTYWGTITFINKTDEVTDWVFHAGYSNYTDIYIEQAGGSYYKQSGELLPASEKDIKEVRKDCVFKLRLLPQEPTTIYMRVRNETGYPPSIEPYLETEESWEMRDRQYYVLQSLFFGALLIMMFYNLAVFVTTKERAYGYYAAFICASLLYFAWFHGFIHLFFTPDLPRLNIYLWVFSIATPILYLQFIRLLLDMPHKQPKIDRYVRYTVQANVVIMLVALGIAIATFNMANAVKLINATLVVDALVFVLILYMLFSLDNKLIRYFLLGVAFFLVASFVGVVCYTYLQWQGAVYAVQVGILGQIMLHSLGLGHKMREAERVRHEVQHQLIIQLEENHHLQQVANQRLEEKVMARTAEIEHHKNQIEEQNEELKALNEEKNNLIRIVAHDLKSPLNRITGLVSVIKLDAERLSDDQANFLDLITETSHKLRKMVMRILDADAIEEHNPQLDLNVANISALVHNQTGDFTERAKDKYISLEVVESIPELPVKIDVSYFEQVFENLLSNAIKFSPKGSAIEVGTKIERGKAIIYIKDQGPGLTEEDKSKLFKKYQKLSAQPTGGEQSTGLGLSIVKRYVELLKGDIWCESEAGQGATFFLSFNLHPMPAPVPVNG